MLMGGPSFDIIPLYFLTLIFLTLLPRIIPLATTLVYFTPNNLTVNAFNSLIVQFG